MENCLLVSTTTNPVKNTAIGRAFRKICIPKIVALDMGSRLQRKQPLNAKETLCCAIARILLARRDVNEADFLVAIEAGVIEVAGVELEGQIAVIVDRGARVSIGTSPLFPLPSNWLEKIKAGRELEEVVEEQTGLSGLGERLGVIGLLTYGQMTRTDLSYITVLSALLPWINRDFYKRLPDLEELTRIAKCDDPLSLCIEKS